MPASTETLVAWAVVLLLVGGGIALLAGVFTLARSRRQTYFRFRRQAILHGWRDLALGVGLLLAAGAVAAFGKPAVEVFVPPTATGTLTATPSATATFSPTAPPTATPSLTLPPSATRPPSDTPDPTLSPTLTVSPTPELPRDRLTPPAGPRTVTPPPGAVVANLRVGRFNDCRSERGVGVVFNPPAKTLYALFDYDNWLPGVEWTNVWRRDGQILLVETLLWDGSTGGCGFADYDNGGQPWTLGTYEVQVFVGPTWLGSAQFQIADGTPAP